MNDTLKLGDWNAVCNRCGFKFKASQLRETWDHLWVCPEDWEPRHPQDFVRGVKDQDPVPFTNPEPADVHVSVIYDYGSGVNENTIPTGTFTTNNETL